MPTSVTLNWNPYVKLAQGSTFLYYNIKAAKVFPSNNEAPLIFQTTINQNFIVTGLEEGISYSISARVVSTGGSSLYSDAIIVNTDSFGVQDKDRLLEVERVLVS